jgi:hypothetical protein
MITVLPGSGPDRQATARARPDPRPRLYALSRHKSPIATVGRRERAGPVWCGCAGAVSLLHHRTGTTTPTRPSNREVHIEPRCWHRPPVGRGRQSPLSVARPCALPPGRKRCRLVRWGLLDHRSAAVTYLSGTFRSHTPAPDGNHGRDGVVPHRVQSKGAGHRGAARTRFVDSRRHG